MPTVESNNTSGKSGYIVMLSWREEETQAWRAYEACWTSRDKWESLGIHSSPHQFISSFGEKERKISKLCPSQNYVRMRCLNSSSRWLRYHRVASISSGQYLNNFILRLFAKHFLGSFMCQQLCWELGTQSGECSQALLRGSLRLPAKAEKDTIMTRVTKLSWGRARRLRWCTACAALALFCCTGSPEQADSIRW